MPEKDEQGGKKKEGTPPRKRDREIKGLRERGGIRRTEREDPKENSKETERRRACG